jgi:hypothetical protein
MTYPAGFDLDQNLSFAGLRYWSFNNPKATRRRDFDSFVCFCHFVLSSERDFVFRCLLITGSFVAGARPAVLPHRDLDLRGATVDE